MANHIKGEATFTVYKNQRKIMTHHGRFADLESVIQAELRATAQAVRLWEQSQEQAEVTIVYYDDVACDTINFWHPAGSYSSAGSFLARKHGRFLSYRQGNGGIGTITGQGNHHLSAEGESRWLKWKFGEVDAVLHFDRDKGGLVQRFRKEVDGKPVFTVVGRNYDVNVHRIGGQGPSDPFPTEEELIQMARATTGTIILSTHATDTLVLS